MFSVFDSKAKAWLPPFICANSAVAIRSFEAACNEGSHDFHRFASDFVLFEIGEWSEHDGTIVAISPVALGVAIEFLKNKENGR